MLYTIVVILIVIISLLLTLVVLLQSGQGDGLTGIAAGGMMGNSGLGARRTADLLSKATSIFGGAFLVLCILANFAISRENAPTRSILQDSALPTNTDIQAPSQTAPAVPQTNTGTAGDAGSSDTGTGDSGSNEGDN